MLAFGLHVGTHVCAYMHKSKHTIKRGRREGGREEGNRERGERKRERRKERERICKKKRITLPSKLENHPAPA